MRSNGRKALLAAGLIAGAAALTGCTANVAQTATPQPAQKNTAEPATAKPSATATVSPAATGETPEETGEDMPGPLALEADGEAVEPGAMAEQDALLLPLEATAKALGWKADSQEKQENQEDSQVRRVITLEKEDSRITVSWTVSDNTAKNITWQKDGLLIPVDARLTTMDGAVYVPAAFFEEAMGAQVTRTQTGVRVDSPKPMESAQITNDSSGKNS